MQVPSVAPRRRGRMDKAPVYETGGCRFDPCRRRHLAVAQWTRAPPSEGGGRTFESCRRGVMSATGPCSSARKSASLGTDEVVGATPTEGSQSWKGTGQMRSPFAMRVRVASPCGCESRPFRSGKRSGQMRGLSRKQVGVVRPLGVRVPPLPPHAAIVERTRRRALNPEAGVRLPVAVLDARSSNRKDVGLLLRLWGFESSSGSGSPGGAGGANAARVDSRASVVQRRGCEHATLVMRVRLPPATPHQTTARRG